MSGKIVINHEIDAKLHNYSCDAYPFECCAILLGEPDSDRIDDIFFADNIAELSEQDRQFEISPLVIYMAESAAKEKGLEIKGIFHSHPDHRASLSDMDIEYMIPKMSYVITSIVAGKVRDTRAFLKEKPDGVTSEIVMIRNA